MTSWTMALLWWMTYGFQLLSYVASPSSNVVSWLSWQQKLAVESLDQQHEENTSSFSFFRMKMTTSIHYPLVRTSHSSYLDVRGMQLSSVPKRGTQSLGIREKAKIVSVFPDFPLFHPQNQLIQDLKAPYCLSCSCIQRLSKILQQL